MPLEIQIVSDIHAEFYINKNDQNKLNFFKPSAKILALLGDICCCGVSDDFEMFKKVITYITPYYEHIIIVLGNHDYYTNPPNKSYKILPAHTMIAIESKIKSFCRDLSKKIHILCNNSLKLTIGKTKYHIIGSTLWSYISTSQESRIQKIMNDYNFIWITDKNTGHLRKILAKDITTLFKKNYRYIKTQITKAAKDGSKVIVLTHHKPYIDASYNEDTFDPAYMSDCSDIIKKPVVLWAFGHTHVSENKIMNGVKIYSNPRGYPGQHCGFSKTDVVKI